MKKIFIFFLSVIAYGVYGQNVGINNPTPAASALLDLTSTNKGLLVPRVALTATNAAGPVPGPVTSLIVYNTATAGVAPNNVLPGFYYWDGVKWIAMSGGTGGRDWSLTGNSGTVVGTNFIGTTDPEPLMFKVNNVKAGYLDYASPYSTAFGYQAHNANTGSSSAAFGYQSLLNNTTGGFNSAFGAFSLFSNTSGSSNTAIGYQSLYFNTSGPRNVAIGYQALRSNTTGSYNTAVGYDALVANTTGNYNTAVGNDALVANITGVYNTAIGQGVLEVNTTGGYNTAVGQNALGSNTIGNNNTAVGQRALEDNTSGTYNSAVGQYALEVNTTGNYNTAVGYEALNTNTTGVRNTVIGYSADVSSGALTNATALGYTAIATASNYVRIGSVTVTSIFGAVAFNTSDGRFKTNVKENVPGLDFITRLRPVTYHFEKLAYSRHIGETRDSVNESELQRQDALGKVSTGFIAQEVEQLADSLGYDFDGLYKPQNDKDAYGLGYQQFVVPLIKAVQEQQKIITEDRERISRLEKQNAELLKLVNKK